MVIKKIKIPNSEYHTKKAIKKKPAYLFAKTKTRKSSEIKVAQDCKITIKKRVKYATI